MGRTGPSRAAPGPVRGRARPVRNPDRGRRRRRAVPDDVAGSWSAGPPAGSRTSSIASPTAMSRAHVLADDDGTLLTDGCGVRDRRPGRLSGMRRIGIVAIVLAVCTACGLDRPPPGTSPLSNATAGRLRQPLRRRTRRLSRQPPAIWRGPTAPGPLSHASGSARPPAGLVLECGSYTAPVDANGRLRARSSRSVHCVPASPRRPPTPAPLVLTSGSDVASATTLAALAAGPASTLLERHPIVAVDRRGTGSSTPIDCGRTFDRRALADLGQSAGVPADADRIAEASRQAPRPAPTRCSPRNSRRQPCMPQRTSSSSAVPGRWTAGADRHRERGVDRVGVRRALPRADRASRARLPTRDDGECAHGRGAARTGAGSRARSVRTPAAPS